MGLTFAAKPRRRFWRLRTLIVLVVVVAVAAVVFVVVRKDEGSSNPRLPTAQVDAFLRAWAAGNVGAMAAQLDAAPDKLADTALSLVKAAPGTRARYTRTTLVRDPIGNGATATYRAHVDVAGFGPSTGTASCRSCASSRRRRLPCGASTGSPTSSTPASPRAST